MTSKKKSNAWARLKLLLILSVAALIMYIFIRPIMKRQLGQQIQNEENTTIVSTNEEYLQELIQEAPNDYFIELEENDSLEDGETPGILIERADFIALFVDTDEIDDTTKNQLSSGLFNKLIEDFPNKKQVLIFVSLNRNAEKYMVKIKANSDTPMRIIEGVKDIFKDLYHDNVDYEYEMS